MRFEQDELDFTFEAFDDEGDEVIFRLGSLSVLEVRI